MCQQHVRKYLRNPDFSLGSCDAGSPLTFVRLATVSAMADSSNGGKAGGEQDVGATGSHTDPATPATAPPSSTSSPPKGLHQVDVELKLLEALETYHPAKLQGMHRHFVLFGLMENLERRLNHRFTPDEVLQLLERFYNLEMLKPDDDEMELLSQEEDFTLPSSMFVASEDSS